MTVYIGKLAPDFTAKAVMPDDSIDNNFNLNKDHPRVNFQKNSLLDFGARLHKNFAQKENHKIWTITGQSVSSWRITKDLLRFCTEILRDPKSVYAFSFALVKHLNNFFLIIK